MVRDETSGKEQRAFYSTPYQYLKKDYDLDKKYEEKPFVYDQKDGVAYNFIKSWQFLNYDERFKLNSLNADEVSDLNIIAEEKNNWMKLPESQSKFHMYGYLGKQNEKYINTDGREVILRRTNNGKGEYMIINDYKNIGTYNYRNPDGFISKDSFVHTITDVIPYLIFGNTPYDKMAKWWKEF